MSDYTFQQDANAPEPFWGGNGKLAYVNPKVIEELGAHLSERCDILMAHVNVLRTRVSTLETQYAELKAELLRLRNATHGDGCMVLPPTQ